MINFCFGPDEMQQFKNKCSGLNLTEVLPPGAAIYRMHIMLLHFVVLHRFL